MLCTAIAITGGQQSSVKVTFDVTIADPVGEYSAYHSAIADNVLAAGAAWSIFLSGNGRIDLIIQFADISTATGASVTSKFVYNNGNYDVYEQGAAFEARTGTDPNGAEFDGCITIGVDNLGGNWWLDPNPTQRIDPIPHNKVDAQSLFQHELGHVLAFSGGRDHYDGTLSGTYESTYDEHVIFDGTNFYFTGPNAVSAFGGPVPLTYGNISHIGNESPRPGQELVSDLMNGAAINWGQRYYISEVDLSIALDTGVALVSLGGDYNGDRTVNAADYTAWRDGNSPDSTTAGYALWVANFGQSTASGSEADHVPEPAALLLALLALTGVPLRVPGG
jgi:hypothetical protein